MSKFSSLTRFFKTAIRDWLPLGRISFAQEGEDLVLARLMGDLRGGKGFFVDIGAHHPTRFSNTYYFYKRGWSGINIDPLPGTMRRFKRLRRRDLTIECGVSGSQGELTYYMFNEPALNTFSRSEAEKKNQGVYRIIDQKIIPVQTLATLLEEHLKPGTNIDFMTIDAENLDHEVVLSGDWNRFRPRYLLVELLGFTLERMAEHPTTQFLATVGYAPCAKTVNTVFFIDTALQKREAS